VYVEKPLALTRDEVNQVIAARNRAAGFFQVGFNRRFAPMAIEAKQRLAGGGACFVVIRVNAGALAKDHWLTDEAEGGGRLLGEACHFVDLARFLVGAPIASVMAQAARANGAVCEDLTATISFTDGSLATIAYTALGDTAHSKELIEGYAGGTVVAVEDFRKLTVTANGRATVTSKPQDKGHAAALTAFVAAVKAGGPAPIAEDELIETSLATLAVRESLRSGTTVHL
jgi:predicted dehydrogenase